MSFIELNTSYVETSTSYSYNVSSRNTSFVEGNMNYLAVPPMSESKKRKSRNGYGIAGRKS